MSRLRLKPNGWKISAFAAPIQTKYVVNWDILIVVLPLENGGSE